MRLRSTRLTVAAVSFVIIYALLLVPIGGLAQSQKKTRKKETAEQKAAREKREADALAALNGLAAAQGYAQAGRTVSGPTVSTQGQEKRVQQPIKFGDASVMDEKVASHNARDDQNWDDEISTITVKSTAKGSMKPASIPGLLAPSQAYVTESEPNGTFGTADALGGATVRVRGYIFAPNDVDFYSFTAVGGERVYAALQTLFDASASGDSVLDVLNTDGSTVIENDPNDGSFNASSSSIAGTVIPGPGTYFLRVRHNVATGTIRPYDLHFNLVSAAPTPETEANNTTGTANPVPASGHISGTVTAISPGEADFFSIALAAGDTVFLSLDMNPERDANVWNGRLGFGMFGNPPANQVLIANDANAGAVPADPNSEAFFFTVKDAGTYFVYVDSLVAAGLGANATYNLSVSVGAPQPSPGSCTTYNSTNVPVAIADLATSTSTITIPGNPRIEDLDISINLNHTFVQDLDFHLQSPAGNDNGILTDIGAATVGGPQTLMDIRLDDEAGLPQGPFTLSASYVAQPELGFRLHWFDGEDAGGVWTLAIRDDATGDVGTLNSWSIKICEPPPPASCPSGTATLYTSDFEANDGGFTHSGTADEWERGLPSFIPITTCNSGTNCWKTDLDNTYNASSNQDLVSPPIVLTGANAPFKANWAMRYHMESANFDHLSVDVREVGNPSNSQRLYDFRDSTMNNTVGNPAVTIAESAGWALYSADISAFAGLTVELVFHVDTDTTVQLAGVGIDDVSVTGCNAGSTATAGQLVISEFRVRGPSGANDEFIEIYNASGADHTVSAASGTGYGVAASDGTTRCSIPNGTVIPNRGHYLCTNSVAYSLSGYATGDATYTTDIPDNAGIALFNNNTGGGSYVLANRLDAVGSTSEANTLYKEGTGYPTLTPFSIDYAWVRDNCGKQGSITTFGPCPSGGLPVDTNNNAVDFYFVDTNGTSAGGGQRLGAPGPENLASPIMRNSSFGVVLLDATVAAQNPPNRVRDFTSDPANNSTFGTLDIYRRVVNNTGGNVTRLRFRVVDITTFPAPSGFADLRPRHSNPGVALGINDAATCLASNGVATTPCTVNFTGTSLETPPSQPNGGGFNSTLTSGTITLGTPLAPGASINVHFLLGIQQTGSFKFFFNVEALP